MKILFFLVALANVVLFMWEFKSGAFVPVHKTGQLADASRKQILLVSELPKPSGAIAATDLINTPETDVKNKLTPLFPLVLDRSSAKNNFATESGVISENRLESVLPERAANKIEFEPKIAANTATPIAPTQRVEKESLEPQTNQADKAVIEKTEAAPEPVHVKPDVVAKTEVNKTAKPDVCYEAGPFADNSAYQLWLKRLNVDEEAVTPFRREGDAVSAYQVYYPAAETMEKSEANVQMLKAQGISDLFLMRKGEEQGQISLGVFSKEQRALLMQSQMLAKGIKAEIKPKYKRKLLHYALIRDKGEVMARLNVLKKNYPEMTVTKLKQCLGDE